jgi:hypothetical protein
MVGTSSIMATRSSPLPLSLGKLSESALFRSPHRHPASRLAPYGGRTLPKTLKTKRRSFAELLEEEEAKASAPPSKQQQLAAVLREAGGRLHRPRQGVAREHWVWLVSFSEGSLGSWVFYRGFRGPEEAAANRVFAELGIKLTLEPVAWPDHPHPRSSKAKLKK